ncbi:MAG TPA: LCP family protein, partial [Micrococcaceae bacterium]|nr:LCP family protein [Micrococcaceae bacterium]
MGRRRAEQGARAAAQRPARAAGASAKGRPATAGRHFRGSRRVPLWLKISAASLAALLVAGVAVAGVMVMRLQGNVQVAELNLGSNSTTAPPADDNHDALQILIMGTDTRAGSDGEYGSTADSGGVGNSDVMMLMNISADNKRVSVISFPRDLIVPIPACRNPATGNFSAPEQAGQLNSALSLGGPGCTVAAINQMTGMNIDHFMLADFNAVKQLTTTLGGVEVCVDTAVKDPASGLDLPAGKSNIQGEQALSFLRERHAFGDASDISRIKAQQSFLASMTRKIKDEGTLTDIPKLYSIAETVTKNLTVDKGLSNVNSMMAIAGRLKNVDLSKVAFVTVPWTQYAPDPGRVQLLQPAASQVFAAVRSDADLTGGTA